MRKINKRRSFYIMIICSLATAAVFTMTVPFHAKAVALPDTDKSEVTDLVQELEKNPALKEKVLKMLQNQNNTKDSVSDSTDSKLSEEQIEKCLEKGNEYLIRGEYTESAKWYRKAAEQGNAEAQYHLGYNYSRGWGVKQDESEAVKWYRKAAEQGFDAAQFSLGVCYENGCGVKQDAKEAVKWYSMAARQGDKYAQSNLNRITKNGSIQSNNPNLSKNSGSNYGNLGNNFYQGIPPIGFFGFSENPDNNLSNSYNNIGDNLDLSDPLFDYKLFNQFAASLGCGTITLDEYNRLLNNDIMYSNPNLNNNLGNNYNNSGMNPSDPLYGYHQYNQFMTALNQCLPGFGFAPITLDEYNSLGNSSDWLDHWKEKERRDNEEWDMYRARKRMDYENWKKGVDRDNYYRNLNKWSEVFNPSEDELSKRLRIFDEMRTYDLKHGY